MPFGNTYGNDILLFTLNSVAFNAAYTATIYHQLHTADPGIAGDQTTNEVNTTQYPNYARVSKTRSGSTDYTVTTKSATNATQVLFPSSGAGTGATLTHMSIGVASTGAGRILFSGGTVTPNIVLGTGGGVQPSFAPGAITITLT